MNNFINNLINSNPLILIILFVLAESIPNTPYVFKIIIYIFILFAFANDLSYQIDHYRNKKNFPKEKDEFLQTLFKWFEDRGKESIQLNDLYYLANITIGNSNDLYILLCEFKKFNIHINDETKTTIKWHDKINTLLYELTSNLHQGNLKKNEWRLLNNLDEHIKKENYSYEQETFLKLYLSYFTDMLIEKNDFIDKSRNGSGTKTVIEFITSIIGLLLPIFSEQIVSIATSVFKIIPK
ncbi:hypothetical protein [Alkaliphilus sp. B6464]|uniref:hypothetical protein n=1 Tax=Alkaliphilus sp. B6464 TaxID=2731219 RepID=UPI001BAB02FA|nr:hypothetical protein [Alkaliphilus sp. B6464]QUH20411.1 hypothetical protein HYG84_11220 [Alkaliphilus sp. B6464]